MKVRYILAYCAVMIMNEYVKEGIITNYKFNSGNLDFLGDVYSKWVELNDVPRSKQSKHALYRNQAVRNSCKNTRTGKKYWKVVGRINYPGISNNYSDVFELKEEFRKVI